MTTILQHGEIQKQYHKMMKFRLFFKLLHNMVKFTKKSAQYGEIHKQFENMLKFTNNYITW